MPAPIMATTNPMASTPEAYAAFAQQLEMVTLPLRSTAGAALISQEIANVHAVGKQVGGKMD